MSGPERLLAAEDNWVTRMGTWFPGERVVFRGQDLHVDLKDMTWMALYLFSISGRRFSAAQLTVLNAIWTYTSFPEPRLWNNRVAALAGTARSTGALGISAAVAVSEATTYGHRAALRCFDFFHRTQRLLAQGDKLADCVSREIEKHRYIYGYGRPIVKTDERIVHLMAVVRAAGLDQNTFVRLAADVETCLRQKHPQLRMNYAALNAALLADMEFSPEQFYLFRIPLFMAGMLPCFIDAANQTEGGFFPLRCERIAYTGTERRRWE